RGGRPGHHRRHLAPPRTDRARLRPPQPLRAGHGARGGRGEGRGRLELPGALKIYTKTGDTGDTHLFGGARVGKDDPRVAAYGDVDELSALLGVVKTQAAEPALARLVGELQKDLFALGAQLADPTARVGAKRKKAAIGARHVGHLERAIDARERKLPPLRAFILPGGSTTRAFLHLARTVCRRAEPPA